MLLVKKKKVKFLLKMKILVLFGLLRGIDVSFEIHLVRKPLTSLINSCYMQRKKIWEIFWSLRLISRLNFNGKFFLIEQKFSWTELHKKLNLFENYFEPSDSDITFIKKKERKMPTQVWLLQNPACILAPKDL